MFGKVVYVGLSSLALLLAGCAGSPVHTSSMNSYELQSVDNYTLCKAYTPREAYSPSLAVINEVRRRGLNCSAIYSYSGTGDLRRAAQILQGLQTQQPTRSRATAHLKSQYTSGLNKICLYNRLGSEEAYTFSATQICPLTMP